MLEGAGEVLGDQPPDALRLKVVGVVIAVREDVGADQDAPFHFVAETLRARPGVHLGKIGEILRAVAVAYAVVAREVRARFRRRDHVVRGNRQLHVREADFDGLRAEPAVFGESVLDAAHHAAIATFATFAEKFLRQADLQAGQGLFQVVRVILDRAVEARRVARVEPRHDIEQEGAILGRARDRAALVERRGVGDHAVARDDAVGRLDSRQVAHRRGLADRTAGVGAGGRRREKRGDGGGRSARGAAGNTSGIPGIARDAEIRGLGRRAHGELVHVRLAEDDRAGGVETLDHRGVVGADEIVEHLRAAGRQPACGAEDVLLRERNPGERPGFARRALLVGGPGLREGPLRVDGDVGPDFRIDPLDAVEVEPNQFDRRDFLRREGLRELLERSIDHRPLESRHGQTPRPRSFLLVSFDHFRHQIEAGFGFGRDGLAGFAAVGFGDLVLAQALRQILRVRHRLDTGGVDGLHFLDQGKYPVQVGERVFRLGVADFDAGEPGDPPDVFQGERHG